MSAIELAWGDGFTRYSRNTVDTIEDILYSSMDDYQKAASLLPYLPKPVKRQKTAEAWLRQFVAKKDVRPWLESILQVGEHRYSSNGHVAGRINMAGVEDTNQNMVNTCKTIDLIFELAIKNGVETEISEVAYSNGIWYRRALANGAPFSATYIDMVRQPNQRWLVDDKTIMSVGDYGHAVVTVVIL